MPFQVIFTSVKVPKGVIKSFTAGEDLAAVCDTGETLTATIIGDKTAHVFLWEQISGDPVTFTTPLDQLSISFTFITSVDRLFRFWIDKDDPEIAQYDDVWVYGTPTDIVSLGLTGSQPIYQPALACRIVSCEDFDVAPQVPTASHDGFAVCTGSDYTLIWNPPPCDLDKISHYIVQSNDGTGWIEAAIIINSEQRAYPAITGLWYRIVYVFNDAAGAVPIYSAITTCEKSARSNGGPSSAWDQIASGLTGISPDITSFSVTIVTLKILNDPQIKTEVLTGLTPGTITIPAYNVLLKTLKILDDPQVKSEVLTGLTPGTITIPAYNVIDLTGGAIGG